jgi:hypothetical protein
MMGAYSYSPFGSLFMGFGMLLAWALPLTILGLIVYGAVRLAYISGYPAQVQTCSNCGKLVRSEWKILSVLRHRFVIFGTASTTKLAKPKIFASFSYLS